MAGLLLGRGRGGAVPAGNEWQGYAQGQYGGDERAGRGMRVEPAAGWRRDEGSHTRSRGQKRHRGGHRFLLHEFQRIWHLAARLWYRPIEMLAGKTRRIKIVDYDPQWPVTFAALKRVIETTVGDLLLSVEHVGSTSVPGLAAKPIVDLDAVIETTTALPGMIQRLARLGYLHQGAGDIPGREQFGSSDHGVPRDGSGTTWPDHHLYVCAQDAVELKRHLAFRDYLREHHQEAASYASLKRRLAQQYPSDIDSYVEGKTAFIEGVLQRAMA